MNCSNDTEWFSEIILLSCFLRKMFVTDLNLFNYARAFACMLLHETGIRVPGVSLIHRFRWISFSEARLFTSLTCNLRLNVYQLLNLSVTLHSNERLVFKKRYCWQDTFQEESRKSLQEYQSGSKSIWSKLPDYWLPFTPFGLYSNWNRPSKYTYYTRKTKFHFCYYYRVRKVCIHLR